MINAVNGIRPRTYAKLAQCNSQGCIKPKTLKLYTDLSKKLLLKSWLVSKFMTSQTSEHIVAINILSDISRTKIKQAKKFGQLIEYNMITIFLEKLSEKCGEKASSRPFYKK